jgi:hypothetical protein
MVAHSAWYLGGEEREEAFEPRYLFLVIEGAAV